VPPDDCPTESDGEKPDTWIDYDDGPTIGGTATGPRQKYVLDNVPVAAGIERTQFLDENGKLITEEYRVHLKDEIKRCLLGRFTSLQDFLKRWTEAERKQVILDELRELGIDLQVLENAVPKAEDFDVFDLVAHIAWDQKPLTWILRSLTDSQICRRVETPAPR
jgi:type I restriction enzyme, R subunit